MAIPASIRLAGVLCSALALHSVPAGSQDNGSAFPVETIKQGSDIYSRTCAPCHGPRMADPEGAFDLRTFPLDQRDRFINSVTKGKNAMPPWGGLFSPAEIESLWAYVSAGEKRP
jgi:mono/diheme cytochrome c family protein